MYSRNAIRIYSLLISIVITFFVQQSSMKLYQLTHNKREPEVIQENSNGRIEGQQEETKEEKGEEQEVWQIMIPKIDLIAPIQEGVEQNILKKTVGHFPRN